MTNGDLDQPSTKKGIALLGERVALATGHPELITASITAEGGGNMVASLVQQYLWF